MTTTMTHQPPEPPAYEHTEHDGVPYVRVLELETCSPCTLLSLAEQLTEAAEELAEIDRENRASCERTAHSLAYPEVEP